MKSKRILMLVAVVAALMALACGGSSGESVQVGVFSEELQTTLHSDPRFESSMASSGLGNDAEGNTVEHIFVILQDENCPDPTYEGCKEVLLDVVRLMLTTPNIDHFVGIEITLASHIPTRNAQGQLVGGKPSLVNKTLDEWREIVGENQ